ncbi:long-chain-fatty-acyl-CoA reductase [Novosphingobium endophyticum]|uniref:Acyl-CoA reductase n=1 Tax=Novosphingobium endophyticum TaxID=1955250 RepID=A0A916TYK9_9SPHN|nr:acyl-CoA reductase [Novosphingobium endophyticum]GGC16515.1 long-chain-fatty-acyl-CoA reductase [Novosphingobium endophyticum]
MTVKTTIDAPAAEQPDSAPFFVHGKVIEAGEAIHRSRDLGVNFATPAVDLNSLVFPRTELPPLLNVPLTEIIDFLVEAGQKLCDGKNPYVEACIERMAKVSLQPRKAIEYQMLNAAEYLDKRSLWELVEQNFPNPKALDEWIPHTDHQGRRSFIRAFPPRLIHVLPGNAPAQGIRSIAQSALVKSVSLFKMASADPFSTVAFLRTMADIDPDHPVVRSMSAIYWRGGDEAIERVLYRPQYFDKLVAWGGGDAINNVMKYIGPGFQLVSFDPKTSISMIGKEAFASEESMAAAAELNAQDVSIGGQEPCVSSRFTFIEASPQEADRYCKLLAERIRVDRMGEGTPRPLEMDLREQIDVLRMMDDEFAVFGVTDGRGVAIRSTEPVDFHPLRKTSNVVCVSSLQDAMKHVNVATQTVGVYPFSRMAELRDYLASGGAQRVVRLGEAGPSAIGNPHDAMYPLHRFVHWMANEDGCIGDPQ